MRRVSYLKRASRRFLAGTRFIAPIQAVEAGVRSLEEWASILTEERDYEFEYLRTRSIKRRQRRTQGRSGIIRSPIETTERN